MLPMHFDSYDGLTGTVTAITYLDPDWRPEHGGQLRLYYPKNPSVDIDPIMDRMVMPYFSADGAL
jgi:SM-20-related protein